MPLVEENNVDETVLVDCEVVFEEPNWRKLAVNVVGTFSWKMYGFASCCETSPDPDQAVKV